MSKQPVTIKVWCREEDLQRTAGLLSWAVGHRVEIPVVATGMRNTYFFVVTDIEQYDDEDTVRRTMGFDIIGKISGVIDWEIMLKECASAEAAVPENAEIDSVLTTLLDDLPIPISIIQRSDGSYVWKWLGASGQSAAFMDAMKAALVHVMKSHALIRSELLG
jgi:hypothetical protein